MFLTGIPGTGCLIYLPIHPHFSEPAQMGPFIHYLGRKGWSVLVQEIDRRCLLRYLPKSIERNAHGMAEYGEVCELVTAEDQGGLPPGG